MTAFVRFSQGPIHERGHIVNPELVVVMDESLLAQRDAMVLGGLGASSFVLVNSPRCPATLKEQHEIAAQVLTQDISTLALEVLGHHLLSAPVAGFTVKTLGMVSWHVLARAVEHELADAGLDDKLIERNLAATRKAFDAAPTTGLPERRAAAVRAASKPFVVPHLPARMAAPSITAKATSAVRTTEGWRVYRPVINLAGCTRCFLCFALCPEGAIHLDPEHYPIIDYEHCKGCLVCMEECPPKVISQIREVAA